MKIELNEETYELLKSAIIRTDMNVENLCVIYLDENVFFDRGFTQEELYSDEVEDQIYEAYVDFFAEEDRVLFVEMLD